MFELIISDHCDAKVRLAIASVVRELSEFPQRSTKHVVECLGERLDPAFREFSQRLPPDHPCGNLPWLGRSGDRGLSDLVRDCGPIDASEAIQAVLRIRTMSYRIDEVFVDTIKSVAGVLFYCACKIAHKNISEQHESRSVVSGDVYCRCCGNLTEVWAYYSGALSSDSNQLWCVDRLSSKYCSDHRVELDGGRSNSKYKKAKNSEALFDRELDRLVSQCGRPGVLPPISPSAIADLYVYFSVRSNVYFGESVSVLRNVARLWVDAKLTDRKKEVLVLLSQGFNQPSIADVLGVSQQAVSKIISGVPRRFFLD